MVLFGKVTEGFLPIECGTRSFPSFDYIQLLHLFYVCNSKVIRQHSLEVPLKTRSWKATSPH